MTKEFGETIKIRVKSGRNGEVPGEYLMHIADVIKDFNALADGDYYTNEQLVENALEEIREVLETANALKKIRDIPDVLEVTANEEPDGFDVVLARGSHTSGTGHRIAQIEGVRGVTLPRQAARQELPFEAPGRMVLGV